MLPDQAVYEYQRLYEKAFGKEIDFPTAQVMANRLLHLVNLIQQPLGNENEKLHKNSQPNP